MSSISELPLLTVGVSCTGILSLCLAGLLPLYVFVLLFAVHVFICMRFTAGIRLSTQQTVLLSLLLVLFELYMRGIDDSLFILRDLIVYFAVLRLILPKTGREIYQIVGIALSEVTLSTIFTQSPFFLLGLVVMALLIPMILSHLDETSFGAGPREKIGPLHWPGVWAGIIITSTILFFIIPRPSSAIIKHGLASRPETGFSEDIDLSRREAVAANNTVVMRIVWSQGRAPRIFYLAGSRLESLSKLGFVKAGSHRSGLHPDARSTDRLTVYPAGLDSLNVFYPFQVSNVSPSSCIRKGSNLYWIEDIPPAYELWVRRTDDLISRSGTDVPRELEGVASLGRYVAGNGPLETRINRMASHLKARCSYTLKGLDIPARALPIHWFVFTGRRGSCEHFASALAVMMRGCGIPTRVATGFLVHEFNRAGGYYIVRACDAHAWVEYFDGSWHTVEATPQVLASAGERSSIIDALRFRWIRWVIQYSLDDQIRIAAAVLFASHNIEHEMGYAFKVSMAAVIAAVLLWLSYLGMKARRSGPYHAVLKALKRKGLVLRMQSSHEEHLEEVAKRFPTLRDDYEAFLCDYLAWRFGGRNIDVRTKAKKLIQKIGKTAAKA
jgi:hypothetical protein